MLPETFAPAAEILPSVTVSVEFAVGSQPPLLVTMVTLQTPSYGCCASAGAAAAPARMETKNIVPMRFERMNQNPRCMGCCGLIRIKCDQSLLRRHDRIYRCNYR